MSRRWHVEHEDGRRWTFDELEGLYDSIYRLNVRCDEPAYVPKGAVRGEGC